MENRTSTRGTKKIDEAFKFDESKYKKLEMKRIGKIITWKAFCNKCHSSDTTVYPSISDVHNK